MLSETDPSYAAYGKFWLDACIQVHAILRDYDVFSSDIDDFIGTLVYAFIYVKLQMVAIGDGSVSLYIAGAGKDMKNFQASNYHLLKNDNFHENTFDIEFDPKRMNIQDGTLAFTTFPGIGYWDGQDRKWKVISKCKVATYTKRPSETYK